MKFKCGFCKENSKLGVLGIDNHGMLIFTWHKDEHNIEHTGAYCTKCGTIHDCLISFLKFPLGMLKIMHPYKITSTITMFDLGMGIKNSMDKFSLNCRETATYIYHLNEFLIEKMIDGGHMGDCFKQPLTMSYQDFLHRK